VDEWSEDYEYDDEPINERESMNRYAAAYSSCPVKRRCAAVTTRRFATGR